MSTNNIYDAKTETFGSSDSSESSLPPKKRMKLNEEANNVITSATKTVAVSDKVKYKGVVEQPNGHWGAQIYSQHQRIWLGTFQKDEEAAMAYDSASLKLHSSDANSRPKVRNFPWSVKTDQELDFQNSYETDAVLTMIKERIYQHKFEDFLTSRSQNVASINNNVGSKQVRGGGGDQESNKCLLFLFQKELTPSDVGKLNRLVIPKKSAVTYLPSISEKETSGVKDVDVVFYDRATMEKWEFRYCYWRSSQSYVFTRGWNGFVKKKNLKEKDVIVFYTCHDPTLEGQSKNYLMIDVQYFNGSVVPEEVNKMVHDSSVEGMKREKFVSSKFRDEETKSEENRGSFMLFGVKIHCS